MKKKIRYRILTFLIGFCLACLFFYVDTKFEFGSGDLATQQIPWFEVFEAFVIAMPLTVLVYLLFSHAASSKLTRLRFKEIELAQAETEQFLILGRLAASIAHEVRNPLNNILLLLDELERISETEDDIHKIGGRIKSNAGRINHAVELVYRLARPADIKQRLETNEFADLVILLNAIREDYARHGASIVVTNKTGRKRVLMSGDYDCLQTIFENLLRNASSAATETPVYVDLEDVAETGKIRVVIYNEGTLPDTFKITTIDELLVGQNKVHGLGLGVIIVNELAKQLRMRIAHHSDGNVVSFEITGAGHRGLFDPVEGIEEKDEMNDGSVPRIDC